MSRLSSFIERGANVGLFSFLSPESNSSSSTSQTTNNTDQRVAADNGGVSVGAGGTYNNNFSKEVADTFKAMIDFSSGAITKSQNTVEEALAANSNLTTQATNNAQLGQTSILTNPTLIWGLVAIAGIFLIVKMKKG